MFTRTSRTQSPERTIQYSSVHGVTHVTIQVAVDLQSEHEPHWTNGDAFNTSQLRIMRTTLRTTIRKIATQV